MSSVVVLAGSKLIASALASGLTRVGLPAQGYDRPTAALDAIARVVSVVLLLHPRFGRTIDLSPMQQLSDANSMARCILLIDSEVVRMADGIAGLPPHCRVNLQSDLDVLVACIREGRSKVWGSEKIVRNGSSHVRFHATLPDGIVLTLAQAEVLRDHCRGYTAVDIAKMRGGSARTVETHMRTIRMLTGVESNVLLALRYAEWVENGGGDPD